MATGIFQTEPLTGTYYIHSAYSPIPYVVDKTYDDGTGPKELVQARVGFLINGAPAVNPISLEQIVLYVDALEDLGNDTYRAAFDISEKVQEFLAPETLQEYGAAVRSPASVGITDNSENYKTLSVFVEWLYYELNGFGVLQLTSAGPSEIDTSSECFVTNAMLPVLSQGTLYDQNLNWAELTLTEYLLKHKHIDSNGNADAERTVDDNFKDYIVRTLLRVAKEQDDNGHKYRLRSPAFMAKSLYVFETYKNATWASPTWNFAMSPFGIEWNGEIYAAQNFPNLPAGSHAMLWAKDGNYQTELGEFERIYFRIRTGGVSNAPSLFKGNLPIIKWDSNAGGPTYRAFLNQTGNFEGRFEADTPITNLSIDGNSFVDIANDVLNSIRAALIASNNNLQEPEITNIINIIHANRNLLDDAGLGFLALDGNPGSGAAAAIPGNITKLDDISFVANWGYSI